MGNAPTLHWLPAPSDDWRARLKAFASGDGGIEVPLALAGTRLDFIRTNALDSTTQERFAESPPYAVLGTKPVRLAILGSSTLAHLHGAVRVAGLRKSIWIDTYENAYGQYFQELLDRNSALHVFAPTCILFAFDARHLTQGLDAGQSEQQVSEILNSKLHHIRQAWRLAREFFGCAILQQTGLNVFPALLGSNEHRLPGSRRWGLLRLNDMIRQAAETDRVDLVAIDDRVYRDGIESWHDAALWARSKQEVVPSAAPVWGDLVARLIAAHQGRAYKALVLDLDNTVWGGVIGDDGLDGIILGQGSPLGEGFASVQEYARELSRRGVILAVASKNDEANALEPFEKHPEMVLRRNDIAAFRADWNDKAGNIRAIAKELNIGLDSIVFLDDNPFERTLVRQELPMVAVPEVPEDPALVPQALADSGYFETVTITSEDRERAELYQTNRSREQFKASSTDIESYLRGLDMRLIWRRFDKMGLQRTVQLINKTNQFNLTTRRYSEEDIIAIINDSNAFGLQLRLVDCFGDNGVIAVVIGRLQSPGGDLIIDSWLMSCRVLGRQVESATLNLVAAEAKRLGASRLIGEYIPTKKNGMVKDHYERLGFVQLKVCESGDSRSALDLLSFEPSLTFIQVEEGTDD